MMIDSWVLVLVLSAGAAGQPAQAPKDPKLDAAEKEITKLRADLAKARADLAARDKALADAVLAEQVARKEAQAQRDVARKAEANAKAAARQAQTDKAEARAALRKEVAAALETAEKAAAAARLAQARAALELVAARQGLDAEKARTLRERKRTEETEKELASARLQVGRLQAELAASQKKPREEGDSGRPASLQGRARIVVEVPTPEAELYVNGRRFFPPGGKVMREFLTPPLEAGRRYFYDLRLEVMRDGRRVTSNRRVVFRADTEQHVDFRQATGGR